MLKQKLMFLTVLMATCVGNIAVAMVFDNRYLPLLQRPRLTVDGTRSAFSVAYMVSTASSAFNDRQQDIPLGQLLGPFDQAQLAKSMEAVGRPNLLPTEFQGVVTKIPWVVNGKRQMQGINFQWNQRIIDWVETGFSWLFMRVNSRNLFTLEKSNIEGETGNLPLKDGDQILLTESLRAMLNNLNLYEGNTAQLGFGDIDWYIRVGNMWDYTMRFRRIDAGARLGLLCPTGQKRELDRPASIPFGGNGFWGAYAAFDGMFELREDWKTGLWFRVSKRFPQTRVNRMPAGLEPQNFGTIVNEARVNPGTTVVFAPYLALENLRKGLVLGLNYYLTWHAKDGWTQCSDCPAPAMLTEVERISEWVSEYFTINVLYDFGKMSLHRDLNPVFTFRWDIPSSLFVISRVDRAQKVELGLTFVF